ncbi:glycosyltransferase [Rhizobium sp. IMFF44]|uniref:glycosyltransferase n=1 Tax=Rhizobium sp. IMFF44 TaxID=3342350 RepID=UPI0035B6DF66
MTTGFDGEPSIKKIFVYVDHTSQSAANSGVQRTVRGLSAALQDKVGEVVFVVWNDQYEALERANEHQLARLSEHDGPNVAGIITQPGVPLHLSALDKADLRDNWLIVPEVTTLAATGLPHTQQLMAYARRFGMRISALIYDLIPLKLDEYAGSRESHSEYLQHLFLAHCLIPISDHARGDLLHFQKYTVPRIAQFSPLSRTIHLPFQMANLERQAFPDPGDDGIILSVGTVEPRKNQVTLIKAFAKLKCAHPQWRGRLIIVGNMHPSVAAEVHELAAAIPDVEIHNFVADEELYELYRQATLCVFPSVEEGFGLPIAEALWLGVPCISANFGSMAEIFPDEQRLKVDTRDVNSLAQAIEALVFDRHARTDIRQRIAKSNLSTWSDYANQVLSYLQTVAGEPRVFCFVHSTVHYHGNTGVQRVARRLSASLEDLGVAVDYLKWDRGIQDFAEINNDEMNHLSQWNGPTGKNRKGLKGAPTQGHWLVIPELVLPDPNFQQVLNAARARGLRVAVVFFDLIPVTLTDIYDSVTQEGFHTYFRMLSEADLLIPLTASGDDDLWRYFSEKLDRLNNIKRKIQHITLPGEFGHKPRALEPAKRRASDGRFRLLSVGTIEPRKNHLAIIHGFRRAQEILKTSGSKTVIELTFAGSTRDHAAYADGVRRELERTPNAAMSEAPDDIVLGQLYEEHDATVFVSLLEGFGIPVVESLWHAKPCITANNGALGDLASDGGCIQVDPRDGDAIGEAIVQMVENHELYNELSRQAVARIIPSWDDYARELTWKLAALNSRLPQPLATHLPVYNKKSQNVEGDRPLLSVVVSTYNRANWLNKSLPLVLEAAKRRLQDVEVLVVDNESSDNTPEVVAPFMDLPFFRYHRNEKNVGMLGNLSVSSRLARGEFVWILGDDDLVKEGVIARVVDTIKSHPRSELIYLNYSYTRFDKPEELNDIGEVIRNATLIAPVTQSHFSEEIRTFAGFNENLFTAIYACIFRRDHAIAAYTQDTSGTPFSSMLTCIPTSEYVLRNMSDRPGYWIGDSYLVVNMNVSWLRWALIWHLERMPDLFDLAEYVGVNKQQIEPYRRNHCADPVTWARHVYFGADPNLPPMFSMERFYERCKHLPEFRQRIAQLQELYTEAYLMDRIVEDVKSPRELAESFGLLESIA